MHYSVFFSEFKKLRNHHLEIISITTQRFLMAICNQSYSQLQPQATTNLFPL